MNPIIKNSLEHAISYQAYKDLMAMLVAEVSTTGNDITEALVNYTKLNFNRMKRWDKTIKIDEVSKNKIQEFNHAITWLVITESWCGDAAHVLPVLHKIAELSPFIDLKIVLRDKNPELMNEFLTHGSRSIPKLIMIDNETGMVLNTYGPRPTEATNYVARYKAKYGSLTPEFKEDLQHWYNNDKGQNIISDVVEIITELQPNFSQ